MGDKEETSGNSCRPRKPEWETSVGDKCKLMRPKEPTVGDKGETRADKGETSVNPCGPRNPEWETSVGDKWATSGRHKCKLMRPKSPRVGDKAGTSLNSCGPRHPEWETRRRQVETHAAQGSQSGRQVWETCVGDKCKLMRPKAPRVRDKGETSVNSCDQRHPEWETRGRQV